MAEPQQGDLSVRDGAGEVRRVDAEHLTQRKSTATTYMLCICAGIFGAHHFYLDRVVHGVVCLYTGNFLMVGWVVDLLAVPMYVRGYNQRAANSAPIASTCKSLSCRLILLYCLGCVAFVIALVKLPRGLHNLRVMDLDMQMAGTSQNPYDLLGVSRGCSATTAHLGYGEQVKRLNPTGRPCTGLCRAKMDDLEKSALFINGGWRDHYASETGSKTSRSARRQAYAEENMDSWENWDDWADFIALEWDHVLKGVGEALRDPSEPPPAPKRPRGRGPAHPAAEDL